MLKAFVILLSLIAADSSLEKQIDNYLLSQLTDYVKYDYEILRVPKHYTSIRISTDENFKLSGDKLYIPVEIKTEHSEAVSNQITLEVNLFQFALVANEAIDRYSELEESQFSMKLINVCDYRGIPVSPNELENVRSRLFIREGEPLMDDMVEEKPAVFAGDAVWINSVAGSVVIKMQGNTRQDGRVGEIIRVKSRENELFRAKVIDSENVLVLE